MPRLRPPPNEPTNIEALMPVDNTPPTDDIVIELDDDELALAPQDEPEPPPAAPAKTATAPPPEPDDAIRQALEAQQRAEQMARDASRERDEANRRVADRDRELQQERGRTEDARYNSVLTAIAAEQSSMDKAEADLAAALQANDVGAIVKAQKTIGVAAARLDRLEENKVEFDQQRETTRTNPPQPSPRQQPNNPESYIAAMDIPDNAKTWLRAHPEFVTDTAKVKKLGAAHNYITENRGVGQFSQAYFDALDQEFGFKAAPAAQTAPPATSSTTSQPQRRSIPVSAPVSREPPTSSGQRQSSNQVTLTAEERQVARNSFSSINGKELTNAEKERLYAMNKAKYRKMLADGTYTDARHQR